MAPSSIKVAIAGATGETGLSIVDALLKHQDYTITALVRPSSLEKPKVQSIKDRGVDIVPLDFDAPLEEIVKAIQGQDIVISVIVPHTADAEKKLASACKEVAVKRFVPSFFAPVCPPIGVNILRETKEEVINHVKKLHLPYTVIDTGGWVQLSLPKTASGKLDYLTKLSTNVQYGDGNYPTSIVDLRDIGRYVDLIIRDDRTLNKYVFAYNDVVTQDEIFKSVAELSGETPERTIVTKEAFTEKLREAVEAYEREKSPWNRTMLIVTQYTNQNWFRGDNLPQTAEYLGYLTTRTLYPDFEFVKLRDFVQESLGGVVPAVYADRSWDF